MFDFSHLPQGASVSEFIGPIGIRTWHKPPSATFVFMMCIGGGGGGANGALSAVNSGGGGGGSGSLTQALFLAHMIPNSLFVSFNGSTGDVAGGGATVVITNYPSSGTIGASSVYIRANGGGGASTATAGSAGSATTQTQASMLNSSLYFVARAGRAGIAGSTTTAANQSIGAAIPILGGCGGSSGNPGNAGSGFTSDIPLKIPDIPGGTAPSGAGSNGLAMFAPFISIGGTSGAGGGSSAGGAGGWGVGYGAGGGGGGTSNSTVGAGGRGGQAYACIIAW